MNLKADRVIRVMMYCVFNNSIFIFVKQLSESGYQSSNDNEWNPLNMCSVKALHDISVTVECPVLSVFWRVVEL